MSKVLITAEKPDAAKKIAIALGVDAKNKGGFFEDDSYIITWAIGHLIRFKKTSEMKEEYKTWSFDPLPMKFNLNIDLTIDDDKKKQFSVIKKLINRSDVSYIVNAGDADREGLLIQEEIYKFAGNKKPIKMLWVQSQTESEIVKGMAHLKERSLFLNLLEEAKARQTVDYMFGISYTWGLALTVAKNNKVSYGRCQTPLLKLLSDREKAIKNFISKDYYIVLANFEKGYTGILVDDDHKTLRFDEEAKAKNLVNNLGKTARVLSVEEKHEKEQPPLLFSLTSLQKYMGSKYQFSPDKTLAMCQKLYEAQLTTYPRTDTEYINEDVFSEIDKHIEPAVTFLNINKDNLLDISNFKRVVKGAKVTGHHALLPTDKVLTKDQFSKLSTDEKLVYEAICKRFISILLPDYEYLSTTIYTAIDDKIFITKGTRPLIDGYKILYKNDQKEEAADENDEENASTLPEIKEGEKFNANLFIKAQKTKAEPRYTGSTIISLMEKSHIGTPATMANIVDTLIKRGYVELNKNKYSVTEYGLDFINCVPDELKDPVIESEFEEKLEQIGEGKLTYDAFIDEIYNKQKAQIEKLKLLSTDSSKSMKSVNGSTKKYICPICKNKMNNQKFSINCDCGFKLYKEIASKKLSEKNIDDLLTVGGTGKIKGFRSKAGKSFDAGLIIDNKEKKVAFVFDNKK